MSSLRRTIQDCWSGSVTQECSRARAAAIERQERASTGAILCIERIGYVLRDQQTAELLLGHADSSKDEYEVSTALDALKGCNPPRPLPSEPLLRLARHREWLVWQSV